MKENYRCCSCAECQQAGVTHLEQRRDPKSGKLIHGVALRKWHNAAEDFQRRVRELAAKKGMH